MLGEDVLESGTRHGAACSIGEELGTAIPWADREPSPQSCCRLLPQRQNALASPLAHDMDAGASLTIEVIQAQTDQLGYAQTCSKGQMQHRSVPNAELRARVWRIEQRLHLFASQIGDERLVGLLHRNGVDAAGLVKA